MPAFASEIRASDGRPRFIGGAIIKRKQTGRTSAMADKGKRHNSDRRPASQPSTLHSGFGFSRWLLIAAVLAGACVLWLWFNGLWFNANQRQAASLPEAAEALTGSATKVEEAAEQPQKQESGDAKPLAALFQSSRPTDPELKGVEWVTEVFTELASKQFQGLHDVLLQMASKDADMSTIDYESLISKSFACEALRPAAPETAFQDETFTVQRWTPTGQRGEPADQVAKP